jgi:ribonuclease Z
VRRLSRAIVAVFTVATVALSLLPVSFAAEMQHSAKTYRIGVLATSAPEGLRKSLRELGYTEGRNVVLEIRETEGRAERVDDLARELARLKIEYKGHSVVISADTRYNQNVIKYGAGADVRIHEVASAKPELMAASVPVQRIIAHRTTPREAGMVFSQANPKMAV